MPPSIFLFFFTISLIFLSQYANYTCFSLPDSVIFFSFPIIGTNISNFLRFENASYVNSEGIHVTPLDQNTALTNRVGRASYYQPLHLWDSVSGQEASFTTHFSFVINSLGQKTYADGLAFFLVPNGSTIPSDSYGGTLGLTPYNNPTDSTRPFVAVEFDTFFNFNFDTINHTHVGIDVKSMKSVCDVVWLSGVETGNVTDVWISYESNSKIVSVTFTNFFPNGTIGNGSVSCPLNLTNLLPEWVTFGFSASTGGLFEQNTIKSWDFSSSTLFSNPVLTPPTTKPPRHGLPTWAIVVLTIIGVFIVIVVCYIFYIMFYRNRRDNLIIGRQREDGIGVQGPMRVENQYYSPRFIDY